ncbi:MAG: hypothetical protein HC888_02340 [Candidatus Competibacteraceae bacterium]|nr:hypothetical protein [Candidatus Competibacteraceae bacterium]
MDDERYAAEMKDLLIRVEGAMQMLNQGNAVFAHRKLQGIKDSLVHRLKRIISKDGASAVEQSIRTAVQTYESDRI